MATRTKTSKPATQTSETKPASHADDILRLTARWKFLEAEKHLLTVEGEPAWRLEKHKLEQAAIKTKLAGLIPQNFNEVLALCDFCTVAITERLQGLSVSPKDEVKMLRALKAGIGQAQTAEWARSTVEKVNAISEARKARALEDLDI